MKQWFKLRYRLSKNEPNLNMVYIDADVSGIDLEEAIAVGKPALMRLINLPEDRAEYLKFIGIRQ